MHYIFALAIQLFLMFKTGTAGQVSKQDEYICFISIFLGVVLFDRQASINPVAEPFQNHSDTFKLREAVTGIDVISWYFSWNRPGAVLPQSWCTLPRQLLPKAYERMTHLKWQQIKKKKRHFFPLKKRWRKPPTPLFWKQNDGNEKNLCIYFLSMAFLRFREHCLCGAAVGHDGVLLQNQT